MTLGENLKYLRKQRGYKQVEISKMLGVAPNTYSQYESNSREPDIKTLIKIADFYMVSVDMLIGRISFQGFKGIEQVS